jgi:RimJ/RimL family protein N-acetyltransferase
MELPRFNPPAVLETPRLRLRQWQDVDREPFAAMSTDPEVMRYFPAVLDRNQSDALVDRAQGLIEERGWGFWALEVKASGEFAGFTGLHTPDPELPLSPCVEVGWRLARAHWGKGFATEAARCSLAFGFDQLGLSEIVSFTSLGNARSRAVMERLGMEAVREFDHPLVDRGSPLRRHILYRLANPANGKPESGEISVPG